MWSDEIHGVVPADVGVDRTRLGDTLCISAPFVGEGLIPFEGVGAAEKGIDGFDFAGGGMIHFAGDGRVVLDGLDQMTLMGTVVKVVT